MTERWCKCGHPEYLHDDRSCHGDVFSRNFYTVCPCPGFQLADYTLATETDLAQLRAMLPYLTGPLDEAIIVMGEDGIRYTFCNRAAADGCTFQEEIHMSFVSTTAHTGTKRFGKRGFLWPIEAYVYGIERRRIIDEILSNLDRAIANPRLKIHHWSDSKPHLEDFGLEGYEGEGADFIEDFRKAIERANNANRHDAPKPNKRVKLRIKQVNGIWWLMHREWMPLCFDSFEEAFVFAKHYIRKD